MSPPQACAQHGDPGEHRARGQEHPGVSAQHPGLARGPAEGQGVDRQSGSHSGNAVQPSGTLWSGFTVIRSRLVTPASVSALPVERQQLRLPGAAGEPADQGALHPRAARPAGSGGVSSGGGARLEGEDGAHLPQEELHVHSAPGGPAGKSLSSFDSQPPTR